MRRRRNVQGSTLAVTGKWFLSTKNRWQKTNTYSHSNKYIHYANKNEVPAERSSLNLGSQWQSSLKHTEDRWQKTGTSSYSNKYMHYANKQKWGPGNMFKSQPWQPMAKGPTKKQATEDKHIFPLQQIHALCQQIKMRPRRHVQVSTLAANGKGSNKKWQVTGDRKQTHFHSNKIHTLCK